MNDRKGFTLLEVMVSLAIFAIIAAVAMSFFKFQTRQGAGSGRKKIAQEAATLALMTLKRDIIGSGFGVSEAKKNLALFVLNGTDTDELYLNKAYHINMDLGVSDPSDSTGTTPQPLSFFTLGQLGATGNGKAWFLMDGGATELVLSDINRTIDRHSLGALITNGTDGYLSKENDSSFEIEETPTPPTAEQKEKGKHTLKFKWSGDAGTEVAPAVRYWLNLAEDVSESGWKRHLRRGTLYRNNTAIIGAQNSIDGLSDSLSKESNLPLVKVTDFQIVCVFDDGTGAGTEDAIVESPRDGNFGDIGFTPDLLKFVKVKVRYIIRGGQAESGGASTPDKIHQTSFRIPGDLTPGPWIIGGEYVLRATPRNLVLTNILGPTE